MGAGHNNVAQLTNGNGVDFRTRVPLSRRFQLEVCRNSLFQPAAHLQSVCAESVCAESNLSAQFLAATVTVHSLPAAQVCGNVKLPLPAAQFEEDEAGDGSLGFGEGSLELNIAQLNPVIYV